MDLVPAQHVLETVCSAKGGKRGAFLDTDTTKQLRVTSGSLKRKTSTYNCRIQARIISFSDQGVVEVKKVDLSLQGQFMKRIKAFKGDDRLRTCRCRRKPLFA